MPVATARPSWSITTRSATASTLALEVNTRVVRRPASLLAQAGGDRCLGHGVEGAGRLVQHEHRWVGGEGPGEGQPLALPAGQVAAVVQRALRQQHVGHLLGAGGGQDRRGIDADDVVERLGEQRAVVGDHGDVRVHHGERELVGRHPSDEHGPRDGVPASRQEVEQLGPLREVVGDDGQQLALGHGEVEAVQSLAVQVPARRGWPGARRRHVRSPGPARRRAC